MSPLQRPLVQVLQTEQRHRALPRQGVKNSLVCRKRVEEGSLQHPVALELFLARQSSLKPFLALERCEVTNQEQVRWWELRSWCPALERALQSCLLTVVGYS